MNKMDNMMELFSDLPSLPGRNLCLRPPELRDTEALQRLTKQDAVYRCIIHSVVAAILGCGLFCPVIAELRHELVKIRLCDLGYIGDEAFLRKL